MTFSAGGADFSAGHAGENGNMNRSSTAASAAPDGRIGMVAMRAALDKRI
jgi:hypothetical protein